MDTIRRIGRYTVPVELFADVTADLRLVVAPEGQELPPEEELAALEEQERAETEAAEAAAAPAAEPALEAEEPAEDAEPGPADDAEPVSDTAE
jgi:hypothetical protein